MSLKDLKDAVWSVAEEMVAEANDLKDKKDDASAAYLHDALKSYARTLRSMVKAAGDDPPPAVAGPQMISPLLTPMSQHILEIERARAEFKKPKKDEVLLEERFEGGDMVRMVGGPASPNEDSTYQNVDPQMPFGAYIALAGGVYQLRNENGERQLVFNLEQTQRVKEQQRQQGR